jgi:thiol reductant ABC exporter CydD subunit
MAAVRARRGPVDIGLLTGDRRVAAELAAAVAAHAVGLACTIAWLLALAAVIDGAFLDGRDLGSLAPLLGVMVALVVVRSAVVWVGDVVAARASGRLRSRIRSHLVEHVVAVGPAGLAHERVGEVSSTIGTGVDELDGYVTRFVPAAALAVIGPLVVFATIAWLDPWTTVILLFAGPMLVLLLAVIGSRTRALTERRFEQLGWLSAFYLDMIRGLATLKAFRRSEDGADTIEDVSRRFGDTTMEVLRTAFQTSLVMEWAATAATALVAVQVSFRMIHDDLPFGTGLAILVLTPEFFVPLRRLALEYHAGQSGDAALARIAEIEALPVSAPATSAAVPPGDGDDDRTPRRGTTGIRGAPSVAFERVTHRYPGADRDALRDLDLRIGAGETLALVGPSGAGKTTVSRLLLRFTDPTGGRILIDGRPLDQLDPGEWRRAVAWVPQDPTILAGTVTDNIRLGDPDASVDRVRRAAEVARATEFVEALPLGFDTLLGEEGLQLSGGQRQRLAIARAALRDAPVVVLDEFTAHLDDAVEIEVRAAIGDLLRGRTALVIAHRAATAAMADRTVRLDRGRVASGPVAEVRRSTVDPGDLS